MKNPRFQGFMGRLLKRAQYEQQEELYERLSGNRGMTLSGNIIRHTDGTGDQSLARMLRTSGARPEIVMLLAGATDGMTYLQQTAPSVFKVWAGDDSTQSKLMVKAMSQALESGKAGMAERLFEKTRDAAKEALERPMDKVKMVDYMAERAEEVRQRIFGDTFCELMVVRNANRQDLIDVSMVGGRDRAVIVHGHGTAKSLTMTDGIVEAGDLSQPEEKLRALVLDACGTGGEMTPPEERIGQNLADEVYGFNVSASPRDIFGRDLQKR